MAQEATARLEARVTEENKRLLLQAAELEGKSLTDFVVDAARTAATATLERHSVMKLSVRDCHVFVRALLNPPKPSANLRAAVVRYKAALPESH